MTLRAFLSVASKGAGLVLLLRILMSLSAGAGIDAQGIMRGLAIGVGIIGAVTATVGNLGAFVQTNIKRLLAYSSISHAGYMLCVLSLLVKDPAVADPSRGAAQAILLYLAVYLFMNLGAFLVAGLISRYTGSENIEDYAGLSRRNPLLALCMAVFMFSLVGLPPFAGFVAKFNVMWVLGRSGGWWWTLVAVIGLNTIFSLYYYARVVRMIYLVPSDRPALVVHPLGSVMSVACAAMLVIMLVAFGPLLNLTGRFGTLHMRARTPAAGTQDKAPADRLAAASQVQ